MKSLIYDKIRLGVAVLLYLCATSWADAKVKLPALISDGMVLQREQSIKVWGTADAGESITVKFQKKSYHATADANGRWSITLPPLKAGGPFPMQVNDIKLNDILVGDVWLCSGQSNMELPVRRVMDMFSQEILSYNNEKIRHILIPQEYNFHAPQEELSATGWKTLTQENVMDFSALAYFFAKEMYEKTGIPVGLINSSWGGTPVEAWISEEGLKEFPLYINSKRLYEDDAYCSHIKKLEGENFYRWNLSLYRGDAGLHESIPWYSANYDDNSWQTVNMFSQSWGNNGLNPIGGSHWLRQDIEIPQSWNGKEATLRLGCIVDADCERSICRNHRLPISSPYLPDTCRCIEIREKQCDRPNRQQRRTTEFRTGETIQNYLWQRRSQSETGMEIPVRSSHATRSGDDVLLVQTGMPIQRHDSSTAKLFHTGRAMVSRRIKRITPK